MKGELQMSTTNAIAKNVFYLQGLDCTDCAKNISSAIEQLPQVQEAELNFSLGKLTVHHKTKIENITRTVAQHGCKIEQATNSAATYFAKRKPEKSQNKGIPNTTTTAKIKKIFIHSRQGGLVSAIFSGALLLMAILLQMINLSPVAVVAAFLLSIITGGWATFYQGSRSLVKFKFDINVLMIIALIGALSLGEWQEGAMIAFLFSLSNTLECGNI